MKQNANNGFGYNILQLQNLVKRDPQSYYDEFCVQHEYYKSLLKLYLMSPQDYNEDLADLVMFLAQVSSCYKSDMKEYPNELMNILRQQYHSMDNDMRMCFCKALILMRNKRIIEAVDLISLFFRLLRAKDKALRKYLEIHIITDIKNMNSKHKNVALNTTLQNLMYQILKDNHAIASRVSLEIMKKLYRKHIWNDAKTVNAIATACFSKVNKILVAAHQFFLGDDEDDEKNDSSDSEDNEDVPTVKDVMAANKVNKKSRRRMKILKRTKQALTKSKKKNKKEVFDFSAIHLLHDPQGMAERLLKMLSEMNERYEIKMMVMNLISRLVGVHELILLNFYALLIRYLKPHQRDVTKILTFAAQAAHECVPPDALEPVVKTIAYNFVTERNSAEVMTVGINAIREICARCPLAISEDLVEDLVEYKKYKNKNVTMAARSLIQLFRKINPQILKRKHRNRPTEATKELEVYQYGASKAKSYIPCAEILPIEPSNEDGKDDAGADSDNDSDGSWINVSHSEDELDLDDDDEEEEEEEEECAEDDDSEEDIEEEEEEKKEKEKNAAENNKDIKSSNHKKEFNKNDKKEKKNTTDIVDDKEKAMTVSQNRILSQEEFKKLKTAQIAKQVQFSKGKKRKIDEEPDVNVKEIVSLKDIEKLYKKPRHTKESRLATVQEGREGREKFGKKKRKNQLAGKTQKVHNKNKAFMMIKHKVRSKQKRSFKDKQISLRNALLKKKKNNR